MLAGWVANSVVIQGSDPGQAIAVDAEGNSYVAGYYSGTMSFGDTTLTSLGASDAFLTKLNPDGQFLWAKSMGGVGDDVALGMAIDTSGNPYMTGYFSGQASFGSIVATSLSERDAYVAKLDANGTVQWVARGGGRGSTGGGTGYAVAADAAGRVFVAGRFNGSGDFAGLPLASVGDVDGFVVGLDSLSGQPLWVQGRGGPGLDSANGVATDTQGNVFVTWSDGVDPLLADRGQPLLSKLAADTGNLGWDKSIAPGDLEFLYNGRVAVAEAAGGTLIYVTGSSIEAIRDTGTSVDSLWRHNLPATAVATDGEGNVYGAGDFVDAGGETTVLDFDPGSSQAIVTARNSSVRFIWKLNSAGELIGLRGGEAPLGNSGNHSITLDALGNIYTTGRFVGPVAQFDTGAAMVGPAAPTGGTAMFVLKTTQERGNIFGHTFNDLDNDGNWDFSDQDANGIWNGNEPGEPSLAGASVYIDANNNAQHDVGEPTAVVEQFGNYRFAHAPAGTHIVRPLLPGGFEQTSPSNGLGAAATITGGNVATGIVLGAHAANATFTYNSSEVPRKSPSRFWQTTQSRLTIPESSPIFGIDVSIAATSNQTRLTLIAPDGSAVTVAPGVTHLNTFNYKDAKGTWTLEIGTFDPWPSYSVTAWSMTVVGQTNAPPPPAPPGVTVTPTGGLVTYEDQSKTPASFTVVLDSQPLTDVTIRVSTTDATEGQVSVTTANFAGSLHLTFTPGNWNVPQQVFVKGLNDQVIDGNIRYTIDTEVSPNPDANVPTDPAYLSLDVPNVAVTNTDNDRKGKIQLTAAGIQPIDASATSLDASHPAVQALVAEAIARWQAAGVETTPLADVPLIVADLPGRRLAETDFKAIRLDATAAGWGWYIDPTPADDLEFTLAGDQGEQNGMDLLTALMHEFGHVLGLLHSGGNGAVMAETLAAGQRNNAIGEHDLALLSVMVELERKPRRR